MRGLLTFAMFQLVWFACVLGAARANGWIGPLAAAGFLALELRRASELRSVLGLAIVGFLADSALLALGLVGYATPGPLAPALLAPPWIAALSLAFAALVPSALGWLRGRAPLAAALGAVGGPLSFLAGERLGAVSIAEPRALGLLALSLEWALLTPLFVACSNGAATAAVVARPAEPGANREGDVGPRAPRSP